MLHFAVVLKLNKMMNKAKPQANMEIQHTNANGARFRDTWYIETSKRNHKNKRKGGCISCIRNLTRYVANTA